MSSQPPALQPSLDLTPEPAAPALTRPLALHAGRAYAAAWPRFQPRPTNSDADAPPHTGLVLVRDDGLLWRPQDAQPAELSGCPVPGLPLLPPLPAACLWSTEGLRAYTSGHRPHPAAVYNHLLVTLDRFIDFSGGLASQTITAQVLAVYVLATWFLPAFSTFPPLWISADHSAGKSRLLHLLARLVHLGLVVSPSTPRPPLRQLAGLGVALVVDDSDRLFPAGRGPLDPEPRGLGVQRDLFLAGAHRGSLFTAQTRGLAGGFGLLDLFGPRLFTTLRPAPPIARALCLPLARSADTARCLNDPDDPAAWPCTPRDLTDDLWALALSHLPRFLSVAPDGLRPGSLSLPAFQLWRPLLLTAAWLTQEASLPHLFKEVVAFASDHELKTVPSQSVQSIRLVLSAVYSYIAAYIAHSLSQTLKASSGQTSLLKDGVLTESGRALLHREPFLFNASMLSECFGRLDDRAGLEAYGSRLSPVLIGRVLASLRVPQSRSHAARQYALTLDQLDRLVSAQGLPWPSPLDTYADFASLGERLFARPLGE